MNTVGTPLLWGGFAVVVAIMLAIDLLLQGRRGSHSMTMKQAAGWSILWVTLSLLFNAAFWWYLVQTQGRAVADPQALAFLTGYLIEKALAVDNVFVWLMLFSYFAVPPALQRGDWHVRAAERQTLQRAGAGGRQLRLLTAAPSRGSVSGTSMPASASGRRAYRPASGRRSPASTGFPSDRPARLRATSCRSSRQGY